MIILLALCVLITQVQSKTQRPNIIVIVTDDQGWGDVGFNGCTDIPTPHLDSLTRSNHGVYNLDAALSLPRLLMEMLVFSRPGYMRLMPGWPGEYVDGSLAGVLVRGGHKMDISWENGKLKLAVLYAGKDGTSEIHYGDLSKSMNLKAGAVYRFNTHLEIVN